MRPSSVLSHSTRYGDAFCDNECYGGYSNGDIASSSAFDHCARHRARVVHVGRICVVELFKRDESQRARADRNLGGQS